jgi:hypothetical protein
MAFTRWLRKHLAAGQRGKSAGNVRAAMHSRSAARFRPSLEALEDRTVPTTFQVTTTLDSGAG